MKKSPATTILLVILVGSSLVSVLFCGLYIRTAMRLRDLQRSSANAQNYRGVFTALVNDTLEYSRKNPSINPILEGSGFNIEGAGVKPKTGAPATTNKPTGK